MLLYSMFTYSLNNLGKVYKNKNLYVFKDVFEFSENHHQDKGYENCIGGKNRNKHKEFSYLNNSGLDQIYFINILNLLYKET